MSDQMMTDGDLHGRDLFFESTVTEPEEDIEVETHPRSEHELGVLHSDPTQAAGTLVPRYMEDVPSHPQLQVLWTDSNAREMAAAETYNARIIKVGFDRPYLLAPYNPYRKWVRLYVVSLLSVGPVLCGKRAALDAIIPSSAVFSFVNVAGNGAFPIPSNAAAPPLIISAKEAIYGICGTNDFASYVGVIDESYEGAAQV